MIMSVGLVGLLPRDQEDDIDEQPYLWSTCSRVGTRWRFPIEASFSLRHTPRRRQNPFCCSEQFGSRFRPGVG